jgi:hypothetical protein
MFGASILLFVAWIAQAPTGLANLGDALSGTGKVADMKPKSGGIGGIGAAPDKPHDDVQVRARAQATETAAGEAVPAAATGEDPIAAAEAEHDHFAGAEHRLAACRIEVARRRRVPPAHVAAGTVTLRWTVQPDGHVRNAEAVGAVDTDLEVAACAKRVMSEWVFDRAKPGTDAAAHPVTVQATYKFTGN